MLPLARPGRDREPQPGTLRRRRVPERIVGDDVIVARPGDGEAVVMSPVAGVVWRSLDDWSTTLDIDRCLADVLPGVSDADRAAVRNEVLQALQSDGLLERG
jgi:hypothetical protein